MDGQVGSEHFTGNFHGMLIQCVQGVVRPKFFGEIFCWFTQTMKFVKIFLPLKFPAIQYCIKCLCSIIHTLYYSERDKIVGKEEANIKTLAISFQGRRLLFHLPKYLNARQAILMAAEAFKIDPQGLVLLYHGLEVTYDMTIGVST